MVDSIDNAPWRNLLFPPSTLCDLSMWLLNHYGAVVHAEPHTLPWLLISIKIAGGKGTMPLVVRGDVRFNTITELTDYFEPKVSAVDRLIPDEPSAKAEVMKLFNDYNENLGLAAAQVAYYYLLPKRRLMVEPFSRGCPWLERAFVPIGYPLIVWLIRKVNHIYEPQIPKAQDTIARTFDAVDQRLADGRNFLVGETLTLADLAFSVMAVPATWPADYAGASPPFDVLPEKLKDVISPLRERPAGRFALDIYSRYRLAGPTAAGS